MIDKTYMLFSRIPLTINEKGEIFGGKLWVKDLRLHLDYISNLNICCPIVSSNKVDDLELVDFLKIDRIYKLELDRGLRSVLSNFFPNFLSVFKAVRVACIVHSGGAGWVFPLSFYILPLKLFLKFKWVIVIESSFWMLGSWEKKTARRLVEHYSHKILLGLCLRLADARIFTQTYYRDYFFKKSPKDGVMINPACWVDDDLTIPLSVLENKHNTNTYANAIKIIFPSRMVESKGVFNLLDAVSMIDIEKNKIHLTIMGDGPLSRHCSDFVDSYAGGIDLDFRHPVDYGREFYDLIREYDYLLVPIISDEQPRVIFDAFSQGVPVIGSDASGVLDVVDENNSLIFRKNDPRDLARVLLFALENPKLKSVMGLAALESVKNKTHAGMHRDREYFIKRTLNV